MINVKALRPGDCLLYSGTGFFSRVIRIKTWSAISHVEIYVGFGKSVASRDGHGVNTYPLRTDGLVTVLRPLRFVDVGAGMRWHQQQIGQAYDWWGLLRFFAIGEQSTTKQFCSEYATRWYRAGGFEPFAKDYDADLVSPGMFLSSAEFLKVATTEAV